jgi:hexosaminidase
MRLTDLIPAPLCLVEPAEPGSYPLTGATALDGEPGTERVAAWLRAELGAATGLELLPGAGGAGVGEGGAGAAGDRGLRLSLDAGLAAEAYRLTVRAGGVELRGGSESGLFWGAQTLRQLLGPEAYRRAVIQARDWALPFVEIEDAPRFGWRGLMLDVARHFLPKADVLRYVDLIAAHKLNVLHLHLTDDQGWRIEIKRYPRLTEIGAWREQSMVGIRDADRRDGRPHGGCYTQDDLREIVAYAAARHITVVPEIDIPGHSRAAIAAYPELGNSDVIDTAALKPYTDWGISSDVLNVQDGTLSFYEHVLEEVLDVFPSTFVHIGGDECPKDQWRASALAQERIRREGLKDEHELQSWFIRHFDRWLAARGRRLIGWDEILEGGLAPGAAVASWRGYRGGIAAAQAGHDVVMCPKEHVYLDYRESDHPDEPIPISFVRTLEDVYRFEPLPPHLREDPDAARHVIGTQANVWTEHMDSARIVDYRTFPRLCAFAEVAWSALPLDPEARDYAGFTARMTTHLARLDALGVEYRHADGPLPWQRRPGVLGRPKAG